MAFRPLQDRAPYHPAPSASFRPRAANRLAWTATLARISVPPSAADSSANVSSAAEAYGDRLVAFARRSRRPCARAGTRDGIGPRDRPAVRGSSSIARLARRPVTEYGRDLGREQSRVDARLRACPRAAAVSESRRARSRSARPTSPDSNRDSIASDSAADDHPPRCCRSNNDAASSAAASARVGSPARIAASRRAAEVPRRDRRDRRRSRDSPPIVRRARAPPAPARRRAASRTGPERSRTAEHRPARTSPQPGRTGGAPRRCRRAARPTRRGCAACQRRACPSRTARTCRGRAVCRPQPHRARRAQPCSTPRFIQRSPTIDGSLALVQRLERQFERLERLMVPAGKARACRRAG